MIGFNSMDDKPVALVTIIIKITAMVIALVVEILND